jgi:hypothetical protein
MVFDTLPPLAYLCALCDEAVFGSGVTRGLKERVNETLVFHRKQMFRLVE